MKPAGTLRQLAAGALVGALGLALVQLLVFWRSHRELELAGARGPLVLLASEAFADFTRGRALALVAQNAALGGLLGFLVALWRGGGRARPARDRLSWGLRQAAGVGLAAAAPVLLAAAVYPAAFEMFFQSLGPAGGRLHILLAESLGAGGTRAAVGAAAAVALALDAARRGVAGLPWRPALVVTALALLTASVTGKSAAPPAPAAAGRPNIVLVLADSLRPDFLGFGGHPRPTSPNLDRLAAGSLVFTNASTVIPRTAASWASLMTGCYPSETGIRTTFSRRRAPRDGIATLPALLARAGYHTAVFADGIERHLADLAWGFEHSRVPDGDYKAFVSNVLLLASPMLLPYALTGPGRRLWPEVDGGFWLTTDPEHLSNLLAGCLSEHAASKPVFAVVFFALCHIPYAAPSPEGLAFTTPGYEGPNRFGRFPDLTGRPVPPGPEQARVRQLYEGAIASVDRAVGRIAADLERLGLAPNTVLLFSSDHGEELFDAGDHFGHGEKLDRVNVSVPLLIRLPGGGNRTGKSDTVVRTIDLAPTLLELARVARPPSMSGTSLVPLLDGRAADLGLIGYAETDLWLSDVVHPERVPYPNFQLVCEVDRSRGDRMVLKRDYERLVDFAKYRRVWNRRGSLEYRPTTAQPHWHRQGDPAGLEAELDRLLVSRFSFARAKRGFYMPPEETP